MADPGVHVEREDDKWAVDIADHPGRTESEAFRRAKQAAHKILAELRASPDAAGLLVTMAGDSRQPVQAHHAGSLWVHDGAGWFLLLNVCGVEWSAQWAADPGRIDALRRNAERLYAGFPDTLAEMERIGYTEAREILATPVTDAAGVARWTDSLFNACVMLSPGLHQAFPGKGQTAGWHHVPKSIWDQQLTKRDDFRLWVLDDEGMPAAVAPLAPRGSGDGHVQVMYATPGSALHAKHEAAHAAGSPLILGPEHRLAQQAFAQQAG